MGSCKAWGFCCIIESRGLLAVFSCGLAVIGKGFDVDVTVGTGPDTIVPPGMVTIKERRGELGLTQWDLAVRVGVSGPIISVWERHLYGPAERHRQALADALSVPIERLFLLPPKKAGRPPIYDYTSLTSLTVPGSPAGSALEGS